MVTNELEQGQSGEERREREGKERGEERVKPIIYIIIESGWGGGGGGGLTD